MFRVGLDIAGEAIVFLNRLLLSLLGEIFSGEFLALEHLEAI